MVGEQTNNTAEYAGIIEALVYCHEDDSNDYLILTDSQLAVKQLNGEWKVKSEKLRSWYDNAKDLIEPHVTIGWVKGSENKADGLTRLAYAEATGLYPHPRSKSDYRVKFTPVSELPELFKEYILPF
jgi:ribonuclease HI